MSTAPYGFLRVAVASPPVRVADPEANAKVTLDFVARAHESGAQVLLFPELGLTGYTCGDLFFSCTTLVGGAERALERLLRETAASPAVVVVGLPVAVDGQLFNAAAVMQWGRLLGVVPKSFLPGYKEYYEERWFSSSREALRDGGDARGRRVALRHPTSCSAWTGRAGIVTLAVEICEDLWVPVPPSSHHAMAGATVLLEPLGLHRAGGKADYRRELVKPAVRPDARRLHPRERGRARIDDRRRVRRPPHDRRERRAPRRGRAVPGARARLLVTDVDTERLRVERIAPDLVLGRRPRSAPGAYRRISLRADARPRARIGSCAQSTRIRSCRRSRRPSTSAARRSSPSRPPASPSGSSTRALRGVVLGLSGGPRLHARPARLRADLRPPRPASRGHPGRDHARLRHDATRTLGQRAPAGRGASAWSCARSTSAPPAAAHPGHRPRPRATRRSVTFQNLQARERTQILMDLANKEGGLVVGTGDLPELALGFCTFAGDHIAMYNVNAEHPEDPRAPAGAVGRGPPRRAPPSAGARTTSWTLPSPPS